MKAWKVIVAAAVIFAAGAVTGGLSTNLGFRPPPQASKGYPWGSRPKGDLVDRMDRALALSPTQRTEIETILKESHERMKELWESIAPQAQAEHRKVSDNIRNVLTADQKAKFDEVFKSRGAYRPGESKSRDDKRRAIERKARPAEADPCPAPPDATAP